MTMLEIHGRLEKLERSNRQLKMFLSICLCSGIALFLMGATANPKVVEAEKFILRDAAGVERGELFATEAARGLVFFKKKAERALALLVSDQMNGLLILDQNGNLRQSFTSKIDESDWSIYRPGSDSAQFGVTDNVQGTALTVRDRTNSERVSLGVSDKGAAVTLADTEGANRVIMTDGELSLATFSKEGDLKWTPGWDRFSPEEQNQMRRLMRKIPK